MVAGYDDDDRELWQIPEVRSWFALVIPKVKYWFYFLNSEPHALGVRFLAYCVCDVLTSPEPDMQGNRGIAIDLESLAGFAEWNTRFLNEMTERMRMSETQEMKMFSDIIGLLFPPEARKSAYGEIEEWT